MSASSVPQPGARCLVGDMAPGLDVRIVEGPYRGATGFVVGFQHFRGSRDSGWLVFLPKRGTGIITIPSHVVPTNARQVRTIAAQRAAQGGQA